MCPKSIPFNVGQFLSFHRRGYRPNEFLLRTVKQHASITRCHFRRVLAPAKTEVGMGITTFVRSASEWTGCGASSPTRLAALALGVAAVLATVACGQSLRLVCQAGHPSAYKTDAIHSSSRCRQGAEREAAAMGAVLMTGAGKATDDGRRSGDGASRTWSAPREGDF